MNYYSVYDSKDESILAFGSARECSKKLGIKVESFYYAISRQRKKGKRKYTIVSERMGNQSSEKKD